MVRLVGSEADRSIKLDNPKCLSEKVQANKFKGSQGCVVLDLFQLDFWDRWKLRYVLY